MNPRYIFSAFFVVACLLTFSLPRLSNIDGAQVVQPMPNPAYADEGEAGPVRAAASVVQDPPALLLDAKTSDNSTQESVVTSSIVTVPPTSSKPDSDSIPLTSYEQGAVLAGFPDLSSFVSTVAIAPPDVLVGVYVPGVLALPVIQQPAGNNDFVSPLDYTITQYAAAAQYGAIALLAHNYLSGRSFFQLQPGQEVILVYGDGSLEKFTVSAIDQFQALNSTNPYSDFIDLSDPINQVQPYSTIFQEFYTTPNRLVFQTCIDANGDPSWGRLFIVADPA